jgi:hypothetical protein
MDAVELPKGIRAISSILVTAAEAVLTNSARDLLAITTS